MEAPRREKKSRRATAGHVEAAGNRRWWPQRGSPCRTRSRAGRARGPAPRRAGWPAVAGAVAKTPQGTGVASEPARVSARRRTGRPSDAPVGQGYTGAALQHTGAFVLETCPRAWPMLPRTNAARGSRSVGLMPIPPRMTSDGPTFLRELMRSNPIPVVVCSGIASHGSERAIRALREGADGRGPQVYAGDSRLPGGPRRRPDPDGARGCRGTAAAPPRGDPVATHPVYLAAPRSSASPGGAGQAGAPTLVQDEETSAVFGLPRDAIALGDATRVVAIEHMAAAIHQAVSWLRHPLAGGRPRA